MFGTGLIVAMRKAVALGAKVIKNPMKAGSVLLQRSTKVFTKKNLKWVASIGRSNAKTAIWMRRGVKMLRTKKSFLGMVGQLGTQLKSAGGGLGWLGKGLSAFDIDFRSPKQFRRDQVAMQESLSMMRLKRANLQKKSDAVQKELNEPPVNLTGFNTPEAKLDELGNHITSMKNNLNDVKHTAKSTEVAVRGFEEYQVRSNDALSEAIAVSSQNTMKATISAVTDSEDKNAAIAADSKETIISTLGGKMDAIEDARQAAEEERRKNDWKRKLFNNLITALDWILNWPTKLAMMAAGLLAGVLAFLAIKYWKPLKTFMTMDFWTGIKQILLRITQAIGWLWGGLVDTIADLGAWIINQVTNLLGSSLAAIAGIFNDSLGEGIKQATREAMEFTKGDLADFVKLAFAGGSIAEDMKNDAKAMADKDLIKQEEAVKIKDLKKVALDAAKNDYTSITYPDPQTEGKAGAKEGKTESDGNKKKKQKSEGNQQGSGNTVLENFGKWTAKTVTAPLFQSAHDKGIPQAVDATVKKGAEAVNSAKIEIDKAANEGTKVGAKGLNESNEVIKYMETKFNEADQKFSILADGLDKAASKSNGNTVTKEGDVINFDGAHQSLQNQNQNI